jgi:glycosyltransferase involved in cell wall biosynthesis
VSMERSAISVQPSARVRDQRSRLRVAHVITGLGAGGTPVMLHKVLAAQRESMIDSCVIGLIQDGPIGDKIRSLGIPVVSLGMRPGVPDPRALWRLAGELKKFQPDLIQSWLYHSDLMSSLVARWVGSPPVVWNLRHATLDPQHDSRSTLYTARACAWLSHRSPARILVNTVSGQQVHADYGYDRSKMQVVPNGFDLERYRPSMSARANLRQSLSLSPETPLIGLVARYSELKGQKLFVEAMSRVAAQSPAAHFVLCGTNITSQNTTLTEWIAASGHANRFHLLGERMDVEQVHAALDLEVSASVSEAFSNSIGEALCCGVPCVVTDVGDSAWLVDDAGWVVPSQDPAAMAQACLQVLNSSPEQRAALSQRARQRMEQNFDIAVIARQYEEIWRDVVSQSQQPVARLKAA